MAIWLPSRAGTALLLLLGLSATAADRAPLHGGPWGPRKPVALAASTFVSGRARFTVLTERLVRVEWAGEYDVRSRTASFEDRGTLAIINRDLAPVDSLNMTLDAGVLVITTSALELRYVEARRRSSPSSSLRVCGCACRFGRNRANASVVPLSPPPPSLTFDQRVAAVGPPPSTPPTTCCRRARALGSTRRASR